MKNYNLGRFSRSQKMLGLISMFMLTNLTSWAEVYEDFEINEEEFEETLESENASPTYDLESWELIEGDAYVTDETSAAGDYSLVLPANESNSVVRYSFQAEDSVTEVYYDFFLKGPGALPSAEMSIFDINGAAISLVNNSGTGQIGYFDAQADGEPGEWVNIGHTYSIENSVIDQEWLRFTIVESEQHWSLYLNGELYRENILLAPDVAGQNALFFFGSSKDNTYIDELNIYTNQDLENEEPFDESKYNEEELAEILNRIPPDYTKSALSQVSFPDPNATILYRGKLRSIASVYEEHLRLMGETVFEYSPEHIYFVDNSIGDDRYNGKSLIVNAKAKSGPKASISSAIREASDCCVSAIIIMGGHGVYPEKISDYGNKQVTQIPMGDFIVGKPKDIEAEFKRNYLKKTKKLKQYLDQLSQNSINN